MSPHPAQFGEDEPFHESTASVESPVAMGIESCYWIFVSCKRNSHGTESVQYQAVHALRLRHAIPQQNIMQTMIPRSCVISHVRRHYCIITYLHHILYPTAAVEHKP